MRKIITSIKKSGDPLGKKQKSDTDLKTATKGEGYQDKIEEERETFMAQSCHMQQVIAGCPLCGQKRRTTTVTPCKHLYKLKFQLPTNHGYCKNLWHSGAPVQEAVQKQIRPLHRRP